MTDLLSQLQNATEGSRELDWRIAWRFGHPSMDCARNDFFPPFAEGSGADKAVPRYSTNLQDAVSLVGDDVEDVKLHIKRGELSSAMIRLRGDAEPFWGKHYKLPMAICEAIIKAHRSKAEIDEEPIWGSAALAEDR